MGDDNELVTQEWLVSQGWSIPDPKGNNAEVIAMAPIDSQSDNWICLESDFSVGLCNADEEGDEDWEYLALSDGPYQTRGAIRLLSSALGLYRQLTPQSSTGFPNPERK
jgi:hypothetical protein